jgi:predicted dinucleotide-binding enzyme
MSSPVNPNPSLAVIGGTGKEGSAIAMRFANAGVKTYMAAVMPLKPSHGQTSTANSASTPLKAHYKDATPKLTSFSYPSL